MTLGEAIVERRSQLGWSQNELARQANMNQPTLNRIETNKRRPRVTTLAIIAKALGVGVDSLLAQEDAAPTPPIDRLGSLEARVSDLEKQLLDALQLGREAVALAQRAQRVKSRRRTVATKP